MLRNRRQFSLLPDPEIIVDDPRAAARRCSRTADIPDAKSLQFSRSARASRIRGKQNSNRSSCSRRDTT